jgi:hypothetical protein
MTSPDPHRLYSVVCPACRQYLGQVFARHADDLTMLHAMRCTASREEHEQACIDIQFANQTGDVTALVKRLA